MHPKMKLGLPEVTLGLIPGWGGTQRLPRIIGVISAIEIMLNNVQLDAEKARYRGLVTDVVSSEEMRDRALKLLNHTLTTGDWKAQREKKRIPMSASTKGPTLEDLMAGRFSDAQLNAMSLDRDSFAAYRQYVNEQMKDNLSRQAALTMLDVVERGCVLPLEEAIQIETRDFMRLVGSPEARQLIVDFLASRKK
jgi:enoyl-CoA hydratase/carnithine racemase